MKLHADHRTVFETQGGVLYRKVAYFETAEEAQDYVRRNNDREAAPAEPSEVERLRAALEELKKYNHVRNDLDDYLFDVAEWGLGRIDDKPDPVAFGLRAPETEKVDKAGVLLDIPGPVSLAELAQIPDGMSLSEYRKAQRAPEAGGAPKEGEGEC